MIQGKKVSLVMTNVVTKQSGEILLQKLKIKIYFIFKVGLFLSSIVCHQTSVEASSRLLLTMPTSEAGEIVLTDRQINYVIYWVDVAQAVSEDIVP